MNIGLITIHKIFNYGSSLQTYALFTKLNELSENNSCTIIDYKYPTIMHTIDKYDSLSKKLLKISVFILKNILRCILFFRRNKQFYDFWKKNFVLTETCTKKNIKNVSSNFDVLVCGSDQIWNFKFTKGDTAFLLDFAENHQICFSYSSAIGKKHIASEDTNIFKKQLSKFLAIGIRDYAVKNELESIIHKSVNTVCDPTLLLSSDKWNLLANQSKYQNKSGFILLYILKYSFNPWTEINQLIETVRKQYKLPVISIYSDSKQNFIHHYKQLYGVSIEDFLCLIRNSSYVITTSFHGTCFSIIYKKNFSTVVFDKEKDSRIFDLLKETGLDNRAISMQTLRDKTKINLTEIDWTASNINNYIAKSEDWLKAVIENAKNETY